MKIMKLSEIKTISTKYKFDCNDKIIRPVFVVFSEEYCCDYELENGMRGWTLEIIPLRNGERILFAGSDDCMYCVDFETTGDGLKHFPKIIECIEKNNSPFELIPELCKKFDFKHF